MASRKPTKNHEQPDYSLSEQQRTAIDLLVSGKNLQATADAIGVWRETVSGWTHHHPGFQASLNHRRQELWREMIDGLRALLPRAVEVLTAELEGEGRLQAALHVLRCCGVSHGIAAPSGPTNPEQIAAQQQLAEDARTHAALEAETTIQRRAYDRSLAALASEPGGLLRQLTQG